MSAEVRGSWFVHNKLFSALAIAVSACGLAACGGGSSDPGGSPGSVSPPPPPPPPPPVSSSKGIVTVSANHVLRDGVLWVPHAVQLVAFVAPPKAQAGAFAAAYAHYSTAELSAIKTWGADSIRFQLSQPGADPEDPLYDPIFLKQLVDGVKFARSIGLNVIVSIQDEEQSGEANSTMLPNDATSRVWKNLAPLLNGDNGIVYEMFNEPQPPPNAADWQQWASAMNAVVLTIRATGATNTLVADGLNFAESLDGVIPLSDPLHQVIYSTHPYFHQAEDQTEAVWMRKLGNASATLPVIVGEWTTATTYYCKPDTPNAGLSFLRYIRSLNIGLVAVTYDFGLPDYGGIVSDYSGTPTSYANNAQCVDTGFGPGTLIQQWYKTGAVPNQLE